MKDIFFPIQEILFDPIFNNNKNPAGMKIN